MRKLFGEEDGLVLLEEGTALRTGRHRGVLLVDGTHDGGGDRSGDRLDTRGGEDGRGLDGGGGLGGFELDDLGVGLGESGFQFLNLLVLGGGIDLSLVEFGRDVDDRGFDGLAEVVAFSGEGDDSGLGGLEAFFDGQILLRSG